MPSRIVPGTLLALALLLPAAGAGGGCRRTAKNLAFGDACSSDNDCTSGICLFLNRTSNKGYCTKPCDLDQDDCPAGKTCATIAEHAGKSTPVCGEPPPMPFGPGGPPMGPPPPGTAPPAPEKLP